MTSEWPFSSFEEPTVIGLLKDKYILLHHTAKRHNFKLYEPILVGSVPSGLVNAQVMNTANDAYIIIYNQGIFTFIYTLAKSAALLLPGEGDFSKIFEHVDEAQMKRIRSRFQEAYTRFEFALTAYLKSGAVDKSPVYPIDKQFYEYSSKITTIAEFFVLAHEFCHITSEHFQENSKSNWEIEYEADNNAAFLTINSYTGGYENFIEKYLGMDFFFSMINIIRKAYGKKESKTHPSPDKRRLALRHLVENQEKKEDIIRICDLIHNIFNRFYSMYERDNFEIIKNAREKL